MLPFTVIHGVEGRDHDRQGRQHLSIAGGHRAKLAAKGQSQLDFRRQLRLVFRHVHDSDGKENAYSKMASNRGCFSRPKMTIHVNQAAKTT
jgi:hypothetical protein